MASQYKTYNFSQMFQITQMRVSLAYVAVGLGKCNGAKASDVAIVVKWL